MNKITTGTSYFANRILRSVKSDMRRLKRLGFDFIVHTYSEYDLKFHYGNMADIVHVTQDAGLKVYLDPWGIGNVFGGEPFSDFVADHFEDSCQILDNGQRVPLACPNSPSFQNYMQEWLSAAISTGADGILWDEPHFHRQNHLKSVPGRWGCRCRYCQSKFETEYGKPMPLIENDEVRVFKAESLVAFLESLTVRSRAAGLENILFLTADMPVKEVIPEWPIFLRLKALDTISTGPYWMWANMPITFVRDYALLLKRLADENKLNHLFWIQGCRIIAKRNDEIRQAIDMAFGAGMRNFALWGFEGCAAESWIVCENPRRAWRTATDSFYALKHKNT